MNFQINGVYLTPPRHTHILGELWKNPLMILQPQIPTFRDHYLNSGIINCFEL